MCSSDLVDFNSSVNSAVNKLIASGLAFGLNRHRTSNLWFDRNFWTTSNDGLDLLPNRKPSEGIDSILDNTSKNYAFECAGYCQLVILSAMRLAYGADKFDNYIKSTKKAFRLSAYSSTGIKISETYTGEIDGTFVKEESNPKPNQPIISKPLDEVLNNAPIGSRILFRNFKISELLANPEKKPKETAIAREILYSGWQLENSIKVGEDKFAAHGISKKSKPTLSAADIKKTLFDIFHKRIGFDEGESEQQFIDDYIKIGQIAMYDTKIY